MKPERIRREVYSIIREARSAAVDSIVNDTGEHATDATDRIMNIISAAREEGRQSAGDRVKALEEALQPFKRAFWVLSDDDRVRCAWNVTIRVTSDALRTANALLAPQAAPADQKETDQ
jgi:hypothetical protein